jgi:hypothetical protein
VQADEKVGQHRRGLPSAPRQNPDHRADRCRIAVRAEAHDDTIAEMTMIIAWENASSRFNRAFRIPSQGFWKP